MGPVSAAAEGRHPSVTAVARWLDVNAMLPAAQATVAQVFARAGMDLLELVATDDQELTRALGLLVQAKDAAVRASVADRGAQLQR